MKDLSQAVTAQNFVTIAWIIGHSVKIKIPGLAMELSKQGRLELRTLKNVSWLLGDNAQNNIKLLFETGEEYAQFVGFAAAKESDVATTLASLGIKPQATMPDGQQRYGMAAIDMLVHKADGQRKMGGRG